MDRIDKHIEHRIDNVYGKFKGRAAVPLLRIFQWRSQLQKGTSGRKGKVENSTVLEVGCPPPENFRIFELPILDFLQFQHDFHSFSDKKGLLLEGGGRGGGDFGPSCIYVKRGPSGLTTELNSNYGTPIIEQQNFRNILTLENEINRDEK